MVIFIHSCAVSVSEGCCFIFLQVSLSSVNLNLFILFLLHPLYNVISPCPSGSASSFRFSSSQICRICMMYIFHIIQIVTLFIANKDHYYSISYRLDDSPTRTDSVRWRFGPEGRSVMPTRPWKSARGWRNRETTWPRTCWRRHGNCRWRNSDVKWITARA